MLEIVNIFRECPFDIDQFTLHELFAGTDTKELCVALKKGQSMIDYESEYTILLHLLQGAAELHVNAKTFPLERGDMVQIAQEVKHDIIAKSDTLIRLSLRKEPQ